MAGSVYRPFASGWGIRISKQRCAMQSRLIALLTLMYEHGVDDRVHIPDRGMRGKIQEREMEVRQLTMTTFVLVQATWPVEKSSHLIERLKPSHVIVHHRNSQDVYYLFSAQEVLGLLTSSLHTSSVYEALHLSERSVTPAFESDTDVERIPDQCIVLEDSDLVGFFDVSFLPELTVRRAGKGHRPLIKPEPELRTLVAEFPERVRLHERFSLLISLSASSSSETGVTMPRALPFAAAVDTLIQPKHSLGVEGAGEAKLNGT